MSFAEWRATHRTNGKPTVAGQLVKSFLFAHAPTMPLVYQTQVRGHDLAGWFRANQPEIAAALREYGAILFRGFEVNGQVDFSRFADTAFEKRAEYIEGATPRTHLGDGLYTATEFPADQEIALHNELSYVIRPPSRLAFCCFQPAESGGQTQICDIRGLLARIDPAVVASFAERGGWLLRRNYIEGFGPQLFKAFGLTTMQEISRYCDAAGVRLQVVSETHVITEQIRPAVHRHPQTGDRIWFNHVAFWHTSSLCPKVRAELDKILPISGYPYGTYYADGSDISETDVAHIRNAYREQEVCFDWRSGDVMLLDNWRVAHGRKPFKGTRRVLVTMG